MEENNRFVILIFFDYQKVIKKGVFLAEKIKNYRKVIIFEKNEKKLSQIDKNSWVDYQKVIKIIEVFLHDCDQIVLYSGKPF